MKESNIFGDRLRTARESARMTQGELADKCRVSRQSVTLYETGKRIPDVGVACRIAKHLGVTVEWLNGQNCRTYGETVLYALNDTGVLDSMQTYNCIADSRKRSNDLLGVLERIVATNGHENVELLSMECGETYAKAVCLIGTIKITAEVNG